MGTATKYTKGELVDLVKAHKNVAVRASKRAGRLLQSGNFSPAKKALMRALRATGHIIFYQKHLKGVGDGQKR